MAAPLPGIPYTALITLSEENFNNWQESEYPWKDLDFSENDEQNRKKEMSYGKISIRYMECYYLITCFLYGK